MTNQEQQSCVASGAQAGLELWHIEGSATQGDGWALLSQLLGLI